MLQTGNLLPYRKKRSAALFVTEFSDICESLTRPYDDGGSWKLESTVPVCICEWCTLLHGGFISDLPYAEGTSPSG